MVKYNFVIPMAGAGTRFCEEGINIPKPLLEIRGRYFFEVATRALIKNSFDFRLCFVILEQHNEIYSLGKKINICFPGSRITVIPSITRGSAESAYFGILDLDVYDGPLIVADCDQWISGPNLEAMYRDLDNGVCEVGVPLFKSKSKNYSYAKLGKFAEILQIAEKEIISNHAVSGCYGFRNTSTFIDLYQCCIEWNKERFMSDILRQSINESRTIKGYELSNHIPFGTPEEYRRLLSNLEQIQLIENASLK